MVEPKFSTKITRLTEKDRVKTFVKGLDDRLEGGIPKNSVVLVAGKAGSMKSSFCFSIIYNQALQEGQRGVYISLEQNRQSLLEHMIGLGMDVTDMDNIIIVDLGKLRKVVHGTEGQSTKRIDWMETLRTQLRSYKETFGCSICVIDSLPALYTLSKFENLRSELFHFFESLRDLKMTTYLVSEVGSATESEFGTYEVESFLSDGIIHLDMERDERAVNLFMGVVKMRKTNHERGYFPLIFDKDGFELVKT
ncbi:MAG: AAA family ATPase [Thermoplasmata archaeon]|nr:AAA family ATPase [Thermoplasmata archaeon]NIS12936.1 AAA family ATPase [Thermoplasmata archaeon]NIS20844.1 AAA family ATPase [Thermoplasmata archaeon]NIT78265.1 AAA family ATPase [Thermoplasmata archaeon]NIU49903.1 AAA family ATPase [Thermoplasmata archaeon]